MLKSKRKESYLIQRLNLKSDPALFHLLNLRSSLLIVHYHIPILLLHVRATAILTNTSDTGTWFHTDTKAELNQLFKFKQKSLSQELTQNSQNYSQSSYEQAAVSDSSFQIRSPFLLPDFLNYSVLKCSPIQ